MTNKTHLLLCNQQIGDAALYLAETGSVHLLESAVQGCCLFVFHLPAMYFFFFFHEALLVNH